MRGEVGEGKTRRKPTTAGSFDRYIESDFPFVRKVYGRVRG
jgi:hypothetical protein